MRSIILVSSIFFCCFCFAQGKIYIKVGQAHVRKSPLALPHFKRLSGKQGDSGLDLHRVIKRDIEATLYFSVIPKEAHLDKNKEVIPYPKNPKGFRFEKWATIGTEFLIKGAYQKKGSDITFIAHVYHVPQGDLILSKEYKSKHFMKERLAHQFVNELVERLTGQKSFLNTKVAVISNHGGLNNKGLFVMDWDGKNISKISTQKTIHISPTWSWDGNRLAYTAYAYHKKSGIRNPDLFIYDLTTQKHQLVSYRKGLNSGASFFPSGNFLLLTLTGRGGSPDIYKIDLKGSIKQRLTSGPYRAMNVEPSISPDGKAVAFSSDRTGRPMIYVMNIQGGEARRLTYAGKYNSAPTWSPDGKKIAFAGYDSKKKNYDIFIVNRNGSGLKRLTSEKKHNGTWSNNEYPTFSPDGRFIMFTSDRTGRHQLFMVSVDGRMLRRITNDRWHYWTPRWSPFLEE